MMAMFFAQRVILGKSSFSAQYGELAYIPSSLKQSVAQVLLDSGLPELVPTAFGGTNEN